MTKIINLTVEEYRSINCPSVSDVAKYVKAISDYHYIKTRVEPRKDTEAMVMGRILDYMVTHGEKPELILSDAKTFNSQKHRDCMAANEHNEQAGVFVVTEDMLVKAENMWYSVSSHEDVISAIYASQKQVQVIRYDIDGNPVLKGMADLFNVEQKRVIDVKKIDRLGSWRHRSSELGYWHQVAAYSMLLNEAHGEPVVTSAGFIVVEDHYPYEIYLPYKTIDQLGNFFVEFELAFLKMRKITPTRRTTWTME